MYKEYPDEQFVRDRIAELCSQKGIAQHKLSIETGHNRTYIHKITSGHSMPSVAELLYICQYLHVPPDEFFKTDGAGTEPVPLTTQEAVEDLLSLSAEDIQMLRPFIKRLKEKQEP